MKIKVNRLALQVRQGYRADTAARGLERCKIIGREKKDFDPFLSISIHLSASGFLHRAK